MPFHPFFGEGSPTKIDYETNRVPFFQPLLEDLDESFEGPGFSLEAPKVLPYLGGSS